MTHNLPILIQTLSTFVYISFRNLYSYKIDLFVCIFVCLCLIIIYILLSLVLEFIEWQLLILIFQVRLTLKSEVNSKSVCTKGAYLHS